MKRSRIHSAEARAAAIADFRDSGDNITQVAARHGISHSTLANWVAGIREKELAYCGSSEFDPRAWEVRGGIMHPLFPERRSA